MDRFPSASPPEVPPTALALTRACKSKPCTRPRPGHHPPGPVRLYTPHPLRVTVMYTRHSARWPLLPTRRGPPGVPPQQANAPSAPRPSHCPSHCPSLQLDLQVAPLIACWPAAGLCRRGCRCGHRRPARQRQPGSKAAPPATLASSSAAAPCAAAPPAPPASSSAAAPCAAAPSTPACPAEARRRQRPVPRVHLLLSLPRLQDKGGSRLRGRGRGSSVRAVGQ